MKKNMPGVPESAQNEASARAFVESIVWPNGPVCPHCKSQDAYRMAQIVGSKKPGREGLLRCRSCKKQFTVTVGTILDGYCGEFSFRWNHKDATDRERAVALIAATPGKRLVYSHMIA